MEERTSDVHTVSLSPLLLGTGGGDVVSFADTRMSAAQVSVLFPIASCDEADVVLQHAGQAMHGVVM